MPSDGKKHGEEREVISGEVSPGPGLCPFENRQIYTNNTTPPGQYVNYRVLSLNLILHF